MDYPKINDTCATRTNQSLRLWLLWMCSLFGSYILTPPIARADAASESTAPTITKIVPGIAQVELEWSKIPQATSYNVYYSRLPGNAANLAAPAQNSLIDTKTIVAGLAEAQDEPVYFVVRAIVAGKPGDPSKEVSAIPSKNATPDKVVSTAKDGQITLTWESIGATSYEVDVGTSYIEQNPVPGLTAISGNSATVNKLTNGTTYFFVVKAITGSVVTKSQIVWETPVAKIAIAPSPKPNAKIGASCIPDPTSALAAQQRSQNGVPTGSPGGTTTPQSITIASGADVLSKFSTTATSGATLATAQIVRGYINAWIKPNSDLNCGVTNAISVEVTATAPVTTAKFTDYAREALLGRRSGIVNVYFNPFAGRDANDPYYNWNDRKLASDHIYIANPFQTVDNKMKNAATSASWDEALSFYSFGFGGRGIKTALTGSSLAAVGTMYAGYGIDGPFHDTSGSKATTAQSGGLSFETYVTGNIANRGTLNSIFGTTNANKTYETVGASLTFWVTGKLFLGLEYDRGIGSYGNRVIHDASLFRFGYGSPSSPPTTTQQSTSK